MTGVNTNGGLVPQTIRALAERIRVERLAPGDRLPSEGTLAEEMAVSRTVVREALRALEALNIVRLNVGSRAQITHLEPAGVALMIQHGVNTEQITVQQLYDVRRALERRIAALAAAQRTRDEADEIVSHADAMAANEGRPDAIMAHDIAMHAALARASRNPLFSILLQSLQGITQQVWPIGWRARSSAQSRAKAVATHQAIARAIAAGEPEQAAELMDRHFDDAMAALVAAGLT